MTGILFLLAAPPSLRRPFMNHSECRALSARNDYAEAPQKREERMRLENKSSTLRLLVTAQLEVFASLEGELCLGLAEL